MLNATSVVSTCTAVLAAASLSSVACAQGVIGWQVAPQTITAPATGESWGYCTALNEDGTVLAVGAPNARMLGSNGVGKVYIYDRDTDGGVVTWRLTQTITAPPFQTGDPEDPYVVSNFAQFGCSVALENDTLVVGSWGWTAQTETTPFSGRAFVFARKGGMFGTQDTFDGQSYDIADAVLAPSDVAALDLFGYEVAIDFEDDDGTIVVGKQLAEGTDAQNNAGAAYVFEGSGGSWTQSAKLTTGSDAAANDNFGEQIAVRDGTVVVGCPKHDGSTGSANSGTVFVFERPKTGWAAATEPTASIRSDDGSANDNFGAAVDVIVDGGGTLITVGAPGYDRDLAGTALTNNGAVYFWSGAGSDWSLVSREFARESNPNNAFGFSVAAAGSFNQPSVVVGSPGYEGGAVNSGTAFNFAGAGGDISIIGTDLWVPSAAASSSLGRTVAHRRLVGEKVVIRALIGSDYPQLDPRLFVFDFSTDARGPDYPTEKQIAAGVPEEPEAPGADGFPGVATGGSPAGGAVPTGGVGGGTNVVIPLTPVQADFGLVIGTVFAVSGDQLYGVQTDGRNSRSEVTFMPVGEIPAGWRFVGSPDVNGDRSGDPVFVDAAGNKLRAWLRDGSSVLAQREVGNWTSGMRYLGFGPLNGGSGDDLILQDEDELVVWFLNDGSMETEVRIPLPGADPLIPDTFAGWEAMAGDVDGDGTYEAIARKAGVGAFRYTLSDDGSDPVEQSLPDQGAGFTLMGCADMDGEGANDLIWHSMSTDSPYFSYLTIGQDADNNEIITEDGGRDWPLNFSGIAPIEMRDLDSNGTGDFILQIGSDAVIFLTEIKTTDNGVSYLGSAYRRNLGAAPGGGSVRGFGVR